MVRVIRHYKPHPGAAVTRSSDALECPNCSTITWAWVDAGQATCRLCGLVFFNRAGGWYLRGERAPKKKTVNPEG